MDLSPNQTLPLASTSGDDTCDEKPAAPVDPHLRLGSVNVAKSEDVY